MARKNNKCRVCGADTGKPTRGYCSKECGREGWRRHLRVREKCMSTIQTYLAIEEAVRKEHLPPWDRHPVPWDNVVIRR